MPVSHTQSTPELQQAVIEILNTLSAWGTDANLAGMARYGIDTTNAFGVPLSTLRPLAKEIGRNHALAEALWESGNREARVLVTFIADPKALTKSQMKQWAREAGSWDICDGLTGHLFRRSPFAWDCAIAWAPAKHEWLRRAAFSLMAALTVHDKRRPDSDFLQLLPLIEAAATDDRNFVKKAVNWALRQIGKRSAELRKPATELAQKLAQSGSRAARWIGKDALREFAKR